MLRKFFDILVPMADHSIPVTRQVHEEVSVFSLQNVVLFPKMALPIHVFEERYKSMAADLAKSDSLLAIAPPAPKGSLREKAGIPSVGAICGAGRVRVVNRYPDGRKDLLVIGLKRIRLTKLIQEIPYVTAAAESIPDIPFVSREEEKKHHRELSLLAKRWVFLTPDLDDSLIDYVPLFTKPHRLADFIAFYFFPSPSAKQEFLEIADRRERVERAMAYAEARIRALEQGEATALPDHKPPISQCH